MSPLLRELSWNELAGSLAWFSALLVDAVEDGASVGFLPPLSCGVAGQYWMEVAQAMKTGGRILIAAYMEDTLVGSVQVDLATKPNALHRAEIQKLVVHRQMRRRGIGKSLMAEAERLSREAGRTLLILDTRQGDRSEVLYLSMGYKQAGVIPGYAKSASGQLDSTVLMYRNLVDSS